MKFFLTTGPTKLINGCQLEVEQAMSGFPRKTALYFAVAVTLLMLSSPLNSQVVTEAIGRARTSCYVSHAASSHYPGFGKYG